MQETPSWTEGIAAEVDFWRRWATQASDAFAADFAWRTNPGSPVQPLLAQFLPVDARSVRILDVGAGPVTVVGKSFGTAVVHLEAADALADHYAPALAEAGFEPLVRSRQCYSEELSEVFPVDSYDLVFARNTLDHSLDPLKCLEEMVAVARPGGVILTQHAENEGLAENYAGLHGWNFTLEQGHVVVWNEQARSCVIDRLAGFAEPVREWEETQGRYNLIFGAYRKL